MIINTFVSDSDDTPKYTEISLKQLRLLNPSEKIYFISRKSEDYFKDYDIEWVSQKDIDGPLLSEFKKLSWFDTHGTPETKHPSPKGFWQKTCERIFYLAEFSKNFNERIWHFENDVITYYPISTIKTGEGISCATIMSPSQATFAVFNFNSNECGSLCNFFLKGFRAGKSSYNPNVHISEMTLLRIAMDEGVVHTFPTLPVACEEDSIFIFDPGSYGQFLGGTNNFHNPGFVDEEHYIGKMLKERQVYIGWENNAPYVLNNTDSWTPSNNKKFKLFNLHIHSKTLKDFVYV